MIERNPQQASQRPYDLIVIGGGVYGICLALEATRHRLRPLLLERDDFGGATSWNSLRIVHGGLRYLQRLDLHRFRESVAERSWFLRWFPEVVKPLPCLMPLYGQGLRRPSVMRRALGCNDRLVHRWAPDSPLPRGRVLDAGETIAQFPSVERRGLRGAALWYDALMTRPRRLVIELLRWACSRGASALNYTAADRLLTRDGRVLGVSAVDCRSGTAHEFHAHRVINAAGPWCRDLAGAWDREFEALFRPSLAFNLLLDVPPPSPMALGTETGQAHVLSGALAESRLGRHGSPGMR